MKIKTWSYTTKRGDEIAFAVIEWEKADPKTSVSPKR